MAKPLVRLCLNWVINLKFFKKYNMIMKKDALARVPDSSNDCLAVSGDKLFLLPKNTRIHESR